MQSLIYWGKFRKRMKAYKWFAQNMHVCFCTLRNVFERFQIKVENANPSSNTSKNCPRIFELIYCVIISITSQSFASKHISLKKGKYRCTVRNNFIQNYLNNRSATNSRISVKNLSSVKTDSQEVYKGTWGFAYLFLHTDANMMYFANICNFKSRKDHWKKYLYRGYQTVCCHRHYRHLPAKLFIKSLTYFLLFCSKWKCVLMSLRLSACVCVCMCSWAYVCLHVYACACACAHKLTAIRKHDTTFVHRHPPSLYPIVPCPQLPYATATTTATSVLPSSGARTHTYTSATSTTACGQ